MGIANTVPTSPWSIRNACTECSVCKRLTPHAIYPEWAGTSLECMVCRNRVKFGRFVYCSVCGTAVEPIGILQPQSKTERIVISGENMEPIEEQWPIVLWESSPINHICARIVAVSPSSANPHLPPA